MNSVPKKNILKILVLPLLLVIGLGLYYKIKQSKLVLPENVLSVSGRIEGYETNIGAKIGGRVDYISSREGDVVKPKMLLVQISDSDIEAQLKAKKALIKAGIEEVNEAKYKLKMIQKQIEEAQFKIKQASQDSQGRIYQSKNMVSSARARLKQVEAEMGQSQAELKLARVRKQRYDNLVAKGVVTQDESDQVTTVYETTQALVLAKEDAIRAAQKDLHAALGQEKQTGSSTYNPNIQSSELGLFQEEYHQASHDLAKAKDNVKNAIAKTSQKSRREIGSTPVVGSSSKSKLGSLITPQHSANFCLIPPDS